MGIGEGCVSVQGWGFLADPFPARMNIHTNTEGCTQNFICQREVCGSLVCFSY